MIDMDASNNTNDNINDLCKVIQKLIDKYETMLEALRDNSIDYILMDSPSAVYWAANSGGAFSTFGNSLMYGYGFGIAVNKQNSVLLGQLNQALLSYQNSDSFKKGYQKYLASF